MNEALSRELRWVFTLVGAVVLGICGWETWRKHSITGRLDLGFAVIGIWFAGFAYYRWSRLNGAVVRGALTLEQWRGNTWRSFMGPVVPFCLWIIVLLVAGVAAEMLSPRA